MRLRPYQDEAIDLARERLRETRSCLLVCPTGGGKTVLGSEIIRSAVLRGRRVLFLAHRRELISQTSDKLRRFGVPHGIIMGAKRMALQEPVQVASVQTVKNRMELLPRFGLIMVDEAHHVTEDNTYSQLMQAWPEAKIVGLTATPWRLDGKGLSDVFDGHVVVRSPLQLRDEGFLVPVGGWTYQQANTEKVAVRGGDFQASALEERVRDKTLYGNIVGEWQAHAGNARTIVFCVSVAHSKELAEAFRGAGVAAEHLDAETPNDERAAILERLKTGQTRVLCNVAVLTEGFDCPAVSCVVLARPTLSTSLFLQMVGRALRPVCWDCGEGTRWNTGSCDACGGRRVKQEARIHDHAGCLKRHGHPYSERDFSPDANIDQTRTMAARRITDNWGAPLGEEARPVVPVAVRMVEEAKKTKIGPNGKPMTPQQHADTVRRASEWRAKSWDDRRQTWERLVQRHGAAKARGVYRWASGFSDNVPHGWFVQAQAAELARAASAVAAP